MFSPIVHNESTLWYFFIPLSATHHRTHRQTMSHTHWVTWSYDVINTGERHWGVGGAAVWGARVGAVGVTPGVANWGDRGQWGRAIWVTWGRGRGLCVGGRGCWDTTGWRTLGQVTCVYAFYRTLYTIDEDIDGWNIST